MEDTLSSPYPSRMVLFLVSGALVSISEELVLKYPYSKLADIASYSLPGETQAIDYPLNEFNELIEYLKTDYIDETDDLKLAKFIKTLKFFEIPIPERLRFRQIKTSKEALAAEDASSSSALAPQSDGLPAYETVSGSSTAFRGGLGSGKIQAEPLTIQQKIALAVEERLTNLLMEHILPLVEGQATSGIYNGAFILVPSNSSTLQKPSDAILSMYDAGYSTEQSDEQVVSLSTSNLSDFKYVKLVRLQGVGNTVQFLTQAQVISELKAQLKARLNLPDLPPPPPPVIPQVASPPPQQKKSRWGWSRSNSASTPPPVPVAPILPPPTPRSPIDIRIEEVSMRRMNHMGLYETTTGTVLVVELFLS